MRDVSLMLQSFIFASAASSGYAAAYTPVFAIFAMPYASILDRGSVESRLFSTPWPLASQLVERHG